MAIFHIVEYDGPTGILTPLSPTLMPNNLKELEMKWQTNTEKGVQAFCDGIAKIAGVPANELENVPNGICERYKEGIKGKASKWRENYLLALTRGRGITQEVQKE